MSVRQKDFLTGEATMDAHVLFEPYHSESSRDAEFEVRVWLVYSCAFQQTAPDTNSVKPVRENL